MTSWGADGFDFTDDEGVRYQMHRDRDIQSNKTIYTVRAHRRGERRAVRDTLDLPTFGGMNRMSDRVILQERIEEIPAIDLKWQYIRDDRIRPDNQPNGGAIFQQGVRLLRDKIDAGGHLVTAGDRLREAEAGLKRKAVEEARAEAARQRLLEQRRREEEKKALEREALESCPAWGAFG